MKFAFILVLFSVSSAFSAPVKTEHVEAELVAERSAAEPGKTLTVALRLRMIPQWHTYWRNPGDSGQPTALEWKLPAGLRAGAIQWPAPQRLPAAHLMNFGYEGEVLLLTDIAVPIYAESGQIAARATWLVCNEERCIPEEADLALALPVGKGTATPWTQAIERTRAALPVRAGQEWRFAAERTGDGVELQVAPPPGVSLASLQFFPFDEGKIKNAGAQAFDGSRLRIPRAEQPIGAFNRVAGVLVGKGLPRPLEIEVPVSGGAAGGYPGLALALAFAFVGGLILNLMPCVLPVLSIKVLGFAGHTGDRGAMRASGLLYALGVVASFWLLAALLVVLNALGSGVGWGFQLQSPLFVALLAVLFLALALNLSGFFEIPFVMPAGIATLESRNRYLNSFTTGVLAVAIASPCTAPFMGPAIGYALGESAATTLAVFTALGAGMALPYLALAWHPAGLRWLPKPGAWMHRFKQVLAIPLYATVAWLGWILALQSGVISSSSDWEKFSMQKLGQYEKQGKAVFVDYTAAWCVTCQVNKQLVLQSAGVERAFRASGMVRLRADWTRRDEEITRSLEALGRKGVPVYAIYRPGRAPELLPEILTRDTVFAALGITEESIR